MYDKILARWLEGKITEEKIDLLVKCGWITEEEGNTIKSS